MSKSKKKEIVYETLWRNKWLTAHAKTLEDMIAGLSGAAETLTAMKADGITLDDCGSVGDDYARLITTDAEVAKKHGLEDRSEEYEEEEDDDEGENEEDEDEDKDDPEQADPV